MDKVSVVILNYLNYKDTIECIESIQNDIYEDIEIVVVDNNSSNESYDVLSSLYSNKVHIIKSEKNLGFAKGNNLGIDYARSKLNCSFVLLVNNDTIFKDKMLITELMKAYDNGIGVIGPRIVQVDGFEQNPVPGLVDKFRVENAYRRAIKNQGKLRSNAMYKMLRSRLGSIKNRVLNRNNPKYPSDAISDNICSEELILHGACMLLTKDYFKYYDRLFPKTFLYYEENILTLITKKVGLKKKFVNSAWIYHKEDQSSLMSFANSNKIKQGYELESMKKCIELFDLSYEQILENFYE